jgi:hypothetical protein
MSDTPPPAPPTQLLDFYAAESTNAERLEPSQPWNWILDAGRLETVRSWSKEQRRIKLSSRGASWNVYTAFKDLAPSLRVSQGNPVVAMHGVVIDYDSKSTKEEVLAHLKELPESCLPQFLEQTLSCKWRVVWVFQRPLLITSNVHGKALMETFVDKWKLDTLLAGYDANSVKPTQIWTNGGAWNTVNEKPVPAEIVIGMAVQAAKNRRLFPATAEIPIDVIAAEVNKRFPGRWAGEFTIDAVSVRFWDPEADNPSGCQVKPDGMLCFTGKQPFVKWAEIFGGEWCAQERALNLGRAAKSLIFDGRSYWEDVGGRWMATSRADTVLALKNNGLSDKAPKGSTVSDVERVLRFIQLQNRVDGAAPLINYPPGVVELVGRRLLNTARLTFPAYPGDATGDAIQYPLLWEFVNTFLYDTPDNNGLNPVDVLLACIHRSVRSIRYNEPMHGQAVMLCGGVNTGKTLFLLRLLTPLLGGRSGNPTDYFHGLTQFSDDLIESALLLIDDEAPPKNENERAKYLARLKSFVVRPRHTYHPKFCPRLEIDWVGRICGAINDDPASVSSLPEVNEATRDKLCFFPQPRIGPWPANVEKKFAAEVPYFAAFIDKFFVPKPEVRSEDRMGIKSFFDPHILELSRQQVYSYNALELIKSWIDTTWAEDRTDWSGTPTELLSQMDIQDHLKVHVRDWSAPKMSKWLTALARQGDSGVAFYGGDRAFKIVRSQIENPKRTASATHS